MVLAERFIQLERNLKEKRKASVTKKKLPVIFEIEEGLPSV
jgi:hypothetical protein